MSNAARITDLRKALEWYGEIDHYDDEHAPGERDFLGFTYDEGRRARQAISADNTAADADMVLIRQIAQDQAENEQLRQRIRLLLVIESYAQDVVNAWTRLGRCEDEFGPYDGACNEKREALDSNILLLQRALVAGREPDVC